MLCVYHLYFDMQVYLLCILELSYEQYDVPITTSKHHGKSQLSQIILESTGLTDQGVYVCNGGTLMVVLYIVILKQNRNAWNGHGFHPA